MAARVIKLLGEPIQTENYAAADATIYPGHLIDVNSSSQNVRHATAGGATSLTFALEREEMGTTIDTAYASGDTVKQGTFPAGCHVNAFIESGVTVQVGTKLESAGDGSFRAVTSGVVLARSLDAITATARTRCRIETF